MIVILKNVHGRDGWNDRALRFGIILLIVVLLYPVYTAFAYQLEIGFLGNILTLWLTFRYKSMLRIKPMKENNWLWPQIIWLVIATIYVGLMLTEDHLIH